MRARAINREKHKKKSGPRCGAASLLYRSAVNCVTDISFARSAGGRMKGVVVIGAGKIGATVAGLLASTGDYQVTLADRSPKFLAISTETRAFASWLRMPRTA